MSLDLTPAIDFLRWRAAWFRGHAIEATANGNEIDANMYQFACNELEEIVKEFNAHMKINAEFGTKWAPENAGSCPPSASGNSDWNVAQFAHKLPDAQKFGLAGISLKFSEDRSEMSFSNTGKDFMEKPEGWWLIEDASIGSRGMSAANN